MAKKKVPETKTMSVRVTPKAFREISRLYNLGAIPDVGSVSGMASALIEEALRKRQEPDEEIWTRLLTHFEERITQHLVDLNANLREATGMILTPKPQPKKQPKARHLLESEEDVRDWINARFRNLNE